MSSEKEPSILDYARYYGLSRNHLEVNPLELLPRPEEASLLSDDEAIWQLLSGHARPLPPERFQAIKESSALLAVTNSAQYEGCEFEGIDPLPRHRIRNLKHELPLLRTDHEVDMLNYIHRAEPNLADEFFPFEKVDDEQDEGFEWPSRCHRLPEMVFHTAQNEKLVVAKDVFAYMGSLLDTRIRDEEPTFDYQMPTYSRKELRDPITPPLLPRSPTPQPYEVSSETGHLYLLSEHSSPTRQQVEITDQSLLEKDAFTPVKPLIELSSGHSEGVWDVNGIGDIYSPLKGINSTSLPPPWKRSRRQDLKVGGPLTPPASDRPPPWNQKNVSFSEVLQDLIPDLPPPIPEPEQMSSKDIDMLFAEHIAPVAAKAEQAIEQEQLQEADTTSRVPVPIMDFTKSNPPWYIAPSETIDDWKKRVLYEMKEIHLNLPPWLQNSQTKKGLSWVPFPMSMGRFELQETVEDDGAVAAFITKPEPIDPDTLIWKPSGLRIFDNHPDSDEEELECGVFPPAGDVHSLIKQRIVELQGNDQRDIAIDSATKPVRNGPQPSRRQLPPEDEKAETQLNTYLAPIAEFSAMEALDQFLGIRKGEVGKSNRPMEKHASILVSETSFETSKARDSPDSKLAGSIIPYMPGPKLIVPDNARYFVASTSLLANRRLVHQIKKLFPLAEILERDFNVYGQHAANLEMNTHLARISPEAPPDEVDLILSPGTGLILTNLQKIKQRSLPGQATRSPVRERIQESAAKYERLVVMVSRTGASSDSLGTNLEESDCEALISITAFLSHLQSLSESEVILVDGDTNALATWIVSLMIKYSSEGRVTLLQEETQWEVLLRQAGMNAFAVLVVLGEMDKLRGSDGRPWGLREFTKMSPEERCRRFEGLLGGRAVLNKVGRVLDAHW